MPRRRIENPPDALEISPDTPTVDMMIGDMTADSTSVQIVLQEVPGHLVRSSADLPVRTRIGTMTSRRSILQVPLHAVKVPPPLTHPIGKIYLGSRAVEVEVIRNDTTGGHGPRAFPCRPIKKRNRCK